MERKEDRRPELEDGKEKQETILPNFPSSVFSTSSLHVLKI